jgi:hypothetical protein
MPHRMWPEQVIWALNVVFPTLLLLLLCHEGGHILVGRLVGFRLRAVRLAYWRYQLGRRVERVPRPLASLAAVELLPDTPRRLRLRHALMVGAGPASDLLVCGSLLAATVAFTGTQYEWSFFAAAGLAGFFAVADLVPVRKKGIQTDGRWLLDWLLRPVQATSLVAVSLLHVLCLDGRLPRDMPEEWLQLALAAPDSSPRSRLAEAYAFGATSGQGRVAAAEQHLARMLSASDPHKEPPAHAQLLAAAAFFAARYQQEPIRARELLAQAELLNSLPVHVSTAVKAAILLAEGDAAGAAAWAESSFAWLTVPPGVPAGWAASDRAELQDLLDDARGRLVRLAS